MPDVVGDQHSPKRQSMGGDHHVQFPDQSTRGHELMADGGVLVRRFRIPGKRLYDAEEAAYAGVQSMAGRQTFQTVQ